MKAYSIVNQRFGRLVVLKQATSVKGHSAWTCLCDCGVTKVIRGELLFNGSATSCGCYRREVGKKLGRASRMHGEGTNGKETAEYRAWTSLRNRCVNPRHKSFCYYGARGIRVCERWDSYANFLADMGRRPSPKHSIDRINNDGDYCPANCRWATSSEQNSNLRREHTLPDGTKVSRRQLNRILSELNNG